MTVRLRLERYLLRVVWRRLEGSWAFGERLDACRLISSCSQVIYMVLYNSVDHFEPALCVALKGEAHVDKFAT
eukprot:1268123-Amphidinium_carterae.1